MKRSKCGRMDGIGIWFVVMQIIGVISIAVNLALNLQEWYFMEQSYKEAFPEHELFFTDASVAFEIFILAQSGILLIQ